MTLYGTTWKITYISPCEEEEKYVKEGESKLRYKIHLVKNEGVDRGEYLQIITKYLSSSMKCGKELVFDDDIEAFDSIEWKCDRRVRDGKPYFLDYFVLRTNRKWINTKDAADFNYSPLSDPEYARQFIDSYPLNFRKVWQNHIGYSKQ